MTAAGGAAPEDTEHEARFAEPEQRLRIELLLSIRAALHGDRGRNVGGDAAPGTAGHAIPEKQLRGVRRPCCGVRCGGRCGGAAGRIRGGGGAEAPGEVRDVLDAFGDGGGDGDTLLWPGRRWRRLLCMAGAAAGLLGCAQCRAGKSKAVHLERARHAHGLERRF